MVRFAVFPLLVIGLLVSGAPACLGRCGRQPTPPPAPADPAVSTPAPPAPPPGPLWFQARTEGTGLVHPTLPRGADHLWVATMSGQGIALIDYDGDGRLDVFQPTGTTIHEARAGDFPANRLYRNLGDGTFEDVTDRAGVAGAAWSIGAFAADYDADGDPDLYVSNMRQDYLYRNNGDGTFTELARESGIVEADYTSSAAWGDFDGDQDLDLYLANFVVMDYERGHPPVNNADGSPCDYCGPDLYPRVHDRLYLNDGDGHFTEASAVSGIQGHRPCYGFTAVPVDVDLDGDLDIFVSNDVGASPNFLLMNQGYASFLEEGGRRGVGLDADGWDESSMGVAVFDWNFDGYPDLAVTNFHNETNTLYTNQGGGVFRDDGKRLGWDEPSRPDNAWGLGVFDFDHDGRLDALINNGHVYPKDSKGVPYEMSPLLLAGAQDGRFERVRASADPADILNHRWVGRGAAFGDLDDDGDLDAVFVQQMGPPVLLVNRIGDGRPSLMIRLEGRPPNPDAIGARVKVEAGGKHWWCFAAPHQSFLSSNDPRQHAGLSGAAEAARVTVYWPGGGEDTVEKVPAGEVTIRQGKGRVNWKPHGKGW